MFGSLGLMYHHLALSASTLRNSVCRPLANVHCNRIEQALKDRKVNEWETGAELVRNELSERSRKMMEKEQSSIYVALHT